MKSNFALHVPKYSILHSWVLNAHFFFSFRTNIKMNLSRSSATTEIVFITTTPIIFSILLIQLNRQHWLFSCQNTTRAVVIARWIDFYYFLYFDELIYLIDKQHRTASFDCNVADINIEWKIYIEVRIECINIYLTLTFFIFIN